MKALVFLSQKSIVIREQSPTRSKEEEVEDENIEIEIFEEEGDCEDIMSDEDEDEDYSCEESGSIELYDSKLDTVDEVLNFRDAITHLEQSNPQVHSYLMSALDQQEQATLIQAINRAMELQA